MVEARANTCRHKGQAGEQLPWTATARLVVVLSHEQIQLWRAPYPSGCLPISSGPLPAPSQKQPTRLDCLDSRPCCATARRTEATVLREDKEIMMKSVFKGQTGTVKGLVLNFLPVFSAADQHRYASDT